MAVIVGLLIASLVVWGVKSLVSVIGGGNSANKESGDKVYEVLVAVRDQHNSDPEEDKKSSMKKGYVIGVYDDGHNWSETERKSYLILKMRLSEKEKSKLTEPVKVKKKKEEKEKKTEESNPVENMEMVGIRKYKINLEKIGFADPKKLLEEQPFQDKIFDWKIVEKVSK